MKKEIIISIVAAIAILLVAFQVNAYVLFALVLFVSFFLYRKGKHKDEIPTTAIYFP